MKINIEIDLENFYAENFDGCEYGGIEATSSLSQEVVEVIKSEVKSAICNQVSVVVTKMATDEFERYGNDKIKEITDFKMLEFISEGKVRKSLSGDEMISVDEKLRGIFDNSNNWNSPYEAIERVGQGFAKELRTRYDITFATNIVNGLEKQGLLKAGVFEALTDKIS